MKRPLRTLDWWICLALAVLTIAYLRTWPHDFMQADEGTFLYEAKRVLAGEVIYRDFFDVIMPTSIYLMAGAFALFGTSIDTARLVMAVVHAGIVAAIFLLCRALAVRRAFAIAAAFAYVAIAFPAFTIATPHWLGTLLTLVIVYVGVTRRWPPDPGACFRLGILTGILLAVQHQRGCITGAGLVLLLGASGLWQLSLRDAVWRVGLFTAGAAAVVLPVLLVVMVAAGPQAVFAALVVHPLIYYRGYNRAWWGQYHTGWVYARYYVYPELVRWLPLVIPLTLMDVAYRAARRTATPATMQLAVCAGIAATAVAAIAYYPDLVHLSLLAPFCFILVAAIAERLLRVLQHAVPATGWVAAGCALLLCVWLARQAQFNIGERRYYHPYPLETAFGHIDFRFAPELDLVNGVRAAAGTARNRELFCYTACAGLYLTTDTINPTPYQLMIPGYNRPDQFDEVVRILESRQVELVVAIPTGLKQAGIRDPVRAYLGAKYQVVPLSTTPSIAHTLWRRRVSATETPH